MNKKIKKIFIIALIIFAVAYLAVFIFREIRIFNFPQPYKEYARKNCGIINTLFPLSCCLEVVYENAKDNVPVPDKNGSCPDDMIKVAVGCLGAPEVCVLTPHFMKKDFN
ncbi:MAG TPA: hypothetical protein PLB52_01500 [Candidatus Moranbacteria bacterium]|nr:hypothetical protein [Candidatus Moranbacteria bacterium]